MMRTTCHWILCALVSALTVPAATFAADEGDAGQVQIAQAQPQPGGQATGPQAPTGVEELVITARKREETVQETPIAVSAIRGEDIEELGIADTNDISSIAPNTYLTMTPGSAANIALSIRGVGAGEPLLSRDSGIALYVDGAYIARSAGAIFDLLDLERVEVLRGPQGTLYGRNATGGAVNFISRKPSLEEFGFQQTFTYGKFDEFLTRTTIDTGELFEGSGLGMMLTYVDKKRDGYVDNRLESDAKDPGMYDTQALRYAVRWQPNEFFTADYSFEWNDLNGRDPAFQLMAMRSDIFAAVTSFGGPTPEIDEDRMERISLDSTGDSIHRIEGHNLTLEGDMGFATIKTITTYREWDNEEKGTELDGNAGLTTLAFDLHTGVFGVTPIDLFKATNERYQEQFTQEIQLLGDVGEQINYVVGAYYFEENFTEQNVQTLFVAPNGLTIPFPLYLSIPFVYEGSAKSWAGYANVTWTPPILDERLSITGGLRYSKDEKDIEQESGASCPFFPPPAGCIPGTNVARHGSDNWNNWDWEGNLNYAWTDALSTYFRVATAYRSGGYNPRSGIDAADLNPSLMKPFNEEQLISYELGLKSQWFDNRITFNAAVFYTEYDDLQIDQFQAGAGGASSITVNAGQANILGAEAELFAQITDNLTGYLNYGWIDPEYDEYEVVDPCALAPGATPTAKLANCPLFPGTTVPNPAFAATVDVADDAVFAYRPDQTFAGGVEFTSDPIGSVGFVLSARVDARFTDELFWHPIDKLPSGFEVTPFIDDEIKEDGYWLFDASATVSEIPIGPRSMLRLTLWGKNLTDEEYLMSGIDFGGLGFAGGIFGPPRTYGATVTFEY